MKRKRVWINFADGMRGFNPGWRLVDVSVGRKWVTVHHLRKARKGRVTRPIFERDYVAKGLVRWGWEENEGTATMEELAND